MTYLKSRLRYFLHGFGSLVSIFPGEPISSCKPRDSYYKPAKSVEDAFRSDWSNLGKDMNKAVNRVLNGEA